MIESKELITGEVQGTSETKFVVLTEEEITKMMKKAAREGAKEGIAAYESKQAIVMAERTEKVRNSAKTLVQHYRQLKKMKDTSVYDPDTVTDLTLAGIFGLKATTLKDRRRAVFQRPPNFISIFWQNLEEVRQSRVYTQEMITGRICMPGHSLYSSYGFMY